MATVSANELSLEKTLEELITEFNSLRGDVSAVTLETLLTATSGILTFEGATDDAYETSVVVVDPTADRTITLPNVTGTVITTANADAGATTTTIGDLDYFLIDDGGTLKKMNLSSVATNLPTISPPSSDGSALGSATLEWADLYLADGAVIYFGDDQDVTLTHAADTSLTLNLMMAATTFEPSGDTSTGDNAAIGYTSAEGLILTGQGSTSDITLKNDADATVFTVPTGTDDILFPDSAKAMWGASSDLEIYHDGSNSYIVDGGTGNLKIYSNQLEIIGTAETLATFVDDGAVTLYYNNTAAIATASGGGTLTGTWEVTTALVPDASDGAALGTTSLEWSDLYLADGAVLGFGDDQDVTLTHVADTGILLNSTMAIQFNDASQYINAPSNAILDINATDEIELNATAVDLNGNLDVSGTLTQTGIATFAARPVFQASITIEDGGSVGSASDPNAVTISSGGIVAVTATTASTDASSGALTVAGGAGVAADLGVGDDLRMISDAAVISFGADSEVTLTHVADTGLLLNSTMAIQFNDSSQYINAPSNAILDINATDEIELNATAIDINGTVDISGTALITGVTTHGGNVISDTDSTDDLGTTGVRWRALYVDAITATDQITATGFTGTLDGILGSGAAAAATTTTLASTTITASGIIKTDDTTAATSTTDGSLQTDGGLSVALDAVIGDDIIMITDASVIHFGVNSDVSLTHVHDTGLLLNSTMKLQFNDASQFIHAPSATVLDIGATDEIELTATLIDVVGNLAVSGNLEVTGTTTTVDTVTMNAQNAVVFEGATADNEETTLSIVDPTTDRTQYLINQSGYIPLLAAVTTTAISSTPEELNLLDGVSGLVQADLTKLAALDATAAEINLIDGGTARGTDAVASGDGLLVNDGGTMRMTNVDTVSTYFASHTVGGGNIVTTGALDSGSITSGFGAIDNGTSNIRSATITAETAFVPDAQDGAALGTSSLQFSDLFLADAALIAFGDDGDVTLTHVADVGLTMTHIGTGDNLPMVLQLKSEEDAIVAAEVIASLEFAAGDSGGTDAATVAAGIHAIAEDTFAADANATKLVFTTGVSETAAASATAKMTLSSAGLLTIADDLIIKNSGTIGTAADSDLLTMGSGNLTVAGTVTATAGATLLIKDAGGSTLKTIKGMT